MIILNSFSLNMLTDLTGSVEHREISLVKAKEIADSGLESAVGHADTAVIFGSQLGTEVPTERRTVSLNKGDEVLVGQYRGPRLPEGATELPEGATITWVIVKVLDVDLHVNQPDIK